MNEDAVRARVGGDDEDDRLAAVRRYDVLDTPPDGSFDRITALAARFFDVPISIISIVDHDRIWFKSHHGPFRGLRAMSVRTRGCSSCAG